MKKYIVTCTGITSRILFGFERTLVIYEPDDTAFAKKLCSILEFRNRNTYRVATADYHSERIEHIVKVTIGEEDGWETYEEAHISYAGEFKTISKYYRRRLKYFWNTGAEYGGDCNTFDEIPDGEHITRQDRIDVIQENLLIH